MMMVIVRARCGVGMSMHGQLTRTRGMAEQGMR
jgi:hypothetical protein